MLPETSKEFFFCDQLIVAEPMLRNDQNISATMIGGSGRSSTLDVCSQMYTHTHTFAGICHMTIRFQHAC